jgi:ATP-binding cassette subfamily B protein
MFAQSTAEWAYMKKTVDVEYHARLDAWRFGNFQGTIQRGAMLFFELTAMGAALYLWSIGSITSGTIVLLQIYVFSALDIVYNVTRNLTRTVSSISDAQQMVRILNTKESVEDPKHPEPLVANKGTIELQDVTFGYEDHAAVFEHFSITIPSGQKIGLVGHSGSGKTTFVKLLLRFLDVQRGAILIDGQDVRSVTQDDLRAHIAYVPQDPLLFHRTIRDNIRYGRPDATDTEIEDAARRAHAHEFIISLPNGYDTFVGERGVRLSGGERQRVAIARAMIKDAPILILDEATSALDSVSERAIQEAFDELMQNKTTIVIAHRLSTIQKMDRIVVFENGNIIEDGSHQTLLKDNKTYAHLWQTQTSGFIE